MRVVPAREVDCGEAGMKEDEKENERPRNCEEAVTRDLLDCSSLALSEFDAQHPRNFHTVDNKQ